MAMPKLAEPYAQSRDDYTTFAALAERLGFGEQFTEGRTVREWLEHMYEKWSAELDFAVPTFEEFWRRGRLPLPTENGLTLLDDFRADPRAHRLGTPSGRIEIFSQDIDGFGYDDCAGHPKWYEPTEWLGGPRAARYPLHLLANQPATRLHSQLDIGAVSQDSKVQGREPIRMHPVDAAARGLADGDVAECSTIAAPAWQAWWSTTACAVTWCSCRPAPGTTRRTPPIRTPCACTATRMS